MAAKIESFVQSQSFLSGVLPPFCLFQGLIKYQRMCLINDPRCCRAAKGFLSGSSPVWSVIVQHGAADVALDSSLPVA